ncbi:MAG: hypothetical protein EXR67_03230 [Dehalococcoidia bacterium]|nr:hypothetical protein [Dehalococcoidia bacterium]
MTTNNKVAVVALGVSLAGLLVVAPMFAKFWKSGLIACIWVIDGLAAFSLVPTVRAAVASNVRFIRMLRSIRHPVLPPIQLEPWEHRVFVSFGVVRTIFTLALLVGMGILFKIIWSRIFPSVHIPPHILLMLVVYGLLMLAAVSWISGLFGLWMAKQNGATKDKSH